MRWSVFIIFLIIVFPVFSQPDLPTPPPIPQMGESQTIGEPIGEQGGDSTTTDKFDDESNTSATQIMDQDQQLNLPSSPPTPGSQESNVAKGSNDPEQVSSIEDTIQTSGYLFAASIFFNILLSILLIALTILFLRLRRNQVQPGNSPVENYMKKNLEAGLPYENIKSALIRAGWQEEEIDQFHDKIKNGS